MRELLTRLLLLANRAIVRLVDDSGGLQRVQVTLLAGEARADVERLQPFGLTTHPEAGAEALVVCIGGARDHPLAIVVDDRRHRPRDLKPGEVCLYSPHGQRLLLRDDGGIDMWPAPGGKVRIGDLDGGAPKAVARVGDRVQVGSGSSAGLWPIVEGSGSVEAR